MEWILIPFFALLLWLWWDGLAAKERADKEARRLCQNADVLFLDDSVAISRLRLCRQRNGRISLYRRFGFEFTTDGQHRYSGYIDVFGELILETYMDAYRI